jgi:hypothetical protein
VRKGSYSLERTQISPPERDPVGEERYMGCFGVDMPPKTPLDDVGPKKR